MAQKKITDLQLIDNVGDDLNFPGDDGIQTYRATALQFKNYVLSDSVITLAKLATEVLRKLVPVGIVMDMSTPNTPDGFLKCNGAAVSRTTYADLFGKLVTDLAYTSQNFTITIATPGVVTKTGHGFLGGERLRLSTTGALPTGLDSTTDYFVYYIDANTFRLQTIAGVIAGTFINTSGTQSGTHSYLQSLWGLGDGSTTFNVPDLRGVFKRAWDDGRGLDPSRTIATLQLDAFKSHTHSGTFPTGYAGTVNGLGGSGGSTGLPYSQSGVGSTGGTETRPINYALMPVIKY